VNRRDFFRLAAAGLVAPIIEPQIKYILPPTGGWNLIPSKPTFAQIIAPGIRQIYYDFLIEEGALMNPNIEINTLKKKYLDRRAHEAWKVVFKP
jgi:hypothetical protein